MAKSLFSLLLILVTLSACQSRLPQERPIDLPFNKIFESDYETVWNATVRVLDIYSIAVAVRNSGLLQTEWSTTRFNKSLYAYPHKKTFLEDVRSRLKIKLSKGFVSESGKPAVRVQVSKELQQYKNVIVDFERVPTDHFEESIILYRVGRQIEILKATKREKAKQKKQDDKKAKS